MIRHQSRIQTVSLAVTVTNSAELATLSSLMGLETSDVIQCLCQRNLAVRNGKSFYKVPLTVEQAADGRDAFAKGCYGYLFDWLINRINQTIQYQLNAGAHNFIGILGSSFGYLFSNLQIFLDLKCSSKTALSNFVSIGLQRNYNSALSTTSLRWNCQSTRKRDSTLWMASSWTSFKASITKSVLTLSRRYNFCCSF